MKRVFISFRAEDRNQVNGLRLLAANPRFEVEFYDESVRTPYDSTNAEYIKRKIRERIARTSVTLCMVSELTHTSTWVDWELMESFEKGNTVICMGLKDGPDRLTLPGPLRQRNHNWYAWNPEFLQQMIDAAP